jgi:WD40 repeat protein
VVAVGDDGCGEPVWLDGHQSGLYSIAFSSWGGRLITAAQDATARVWDRDGRLLAVLDDHRDRVYQAELDRRGDFAVTASRDGAVRVWKVPPAVPEGEQVLYLVLDPQLGGAPYAAFSPDGRYVAGAYWGDTAMFWHLWAEDEDSPPDIRAVWGEERARLAIVREAHRFLQENRLGLALEEEEGGR